MARHIKVAAAQMGPNNEGTSREEIVERMLALLDQAVAEERRADRLSRDGAHDVLPQARPRRLRPVLRDRDAAQGARAPLLRRAARGAHRRATWASARRTRASYFNTALLTDETGTLCGTFRKIHLPGYAAARRPRAGLRAATTSSHGDTGYRVFDAARRQGRHRDLPGPALSRSPIAAWASRAPRSS